jgi:diguanylate cyclase (GGDEF)-like protein
MTTYPDSPGDQEPGLTDPVQSAFVLAVRLMQAGRASLLIRRNGEPVLVAAAAVGIKPSDVPLIRVPVGRGIAGLVAERGVNLLGVIQDQTFLSTPVITHRGVEGVLNMTERLGGRLYTSTDLAASLTVAGHIGVLLEYRRQAQIDFVSGLPNRQAYEEAAERELRRSEREGRQMSIVILDADGLKETNDRFGHAAGDRLIQAVGRGLLGCIRQYDFASRFGGDEFALILAGTQDGEASVMERVRAGISAAIAEAGLGVFGASIGVSIYPADGTTVEQLMAAADTRMYEDKRRRKVGR